MVSTARVGILLLVLAGLVLSAVLPVRTYLEQRSQISALERGVADERSAVAALQVTAAHWQDPAFVSAQARERLRLVAPGETGYIVTDSGAASSATPAPAAPPTATAGPARPTVSGSPTVPARPTVPVVRGGEATARLGSAAPWWTPHPTPGR